MIFITAISLGFLGNFHCLGMCGPIALSLPVGKFSFWRKTASILAYNLGRITTYGIIGILLGFFGTGLKLLSTLQILSVVAGSLLVLFGLLTILGKTSFNFKSNYKVVFFIKQKLGSLLKKKSLDSFLLLGIFNGLLPCGLVYAAAISSLVTGSVLGSTIYMILFGVGTLPLMILLPFIGQIVTLKFRNIVRKLVPISLIVFGILFILRGSNLGIKYISPKFETETKLIQGENITTNTVDCH